MRLYSSAQNEEHLYHSKNPPPARRARNMPSLSTLPRRHREQARWPQLRWPSLRRWKPVSTPARFRTWWSPRMWALCQHGWAGHQTKRQRPKIAARHVSSSPSRATVSMTSGVTMSVGKAGLRNCASMPTTTAESINGGLNIPARRVDRCEMQILRTIALVPKAASMLSRQLDNVRRIAAVVNSPSRVNASFELRRAAMAAELTI